MGRPARRAAALALLVAATTLSLQVLVHRMVSAKLLNNFAFLVISLTMLGFAFSGIVLTRLLDRVLVRWADAQSTCAAGLVLSTLAVGTAFYHAGGGNQWAVTASAFLREAVAWLPAALALAVPFTFAGFMLGSLLSDPSLPARRVYGFDLVGSALGAFAVLPAIRHLGVEAATLGALALLLAGTLVLAPPSRRGVWALVAVTAVILGLASWQREALFRMRPREGSPLSLRDTLGPPYGVEYIEWDPVARIEVSRITPPDPARFAYPSLVGGDPDFLRRFRRFLTQNDWAFTYMVDWDGRPESLRGIEQTIYAAAYQTTSVTNPRVLVIGVGGGFDVLTALRFGAREVTGVEINGATLNIVKHVYADYCRPWARDPRVRLVEDEGRHYLTTHDLRYDVIQLSGVDSYSGTPAAVHVFSENYLYTAEALDLYLSRLSDDGILNLMRLEHRPPQEMLRALVTAVQALRRRGVRDPANHLLTVTARQATFTALLVKRTPFTDAERSRLIRWADASPYFLTSSAPGFNAERENAYEAFLAEADPGRERAFVRRYPFDISPTEDDRPFFFRTSRWSQLFSSPLRAAGYLPPMEASLVLLGLAIGLCALVCLYLPLRLLPGRRPRPAGSWRFAVYFAAIGLGYFAVEIALLQKFGLFLGHPNYALSVVLAALLLATGLGSLLSGPLLRLLRELRFGAYLLAGFVLLERALALPALGSLAWLPFAARAVLVFLLVLPLGLVLGLFLPAGIERLKLVAPALVPWAWGINGIFSVLAPVLAIGFSISWGMSALLLSSLPFYLVAGWALPRAAAGAAATAT